MESLRNKPQHKVTVGFFILCVLVNRKRMASGQLVRQANRHFGTKAQVDTTNEARANKAKPKKAKPNEVTPKTKGKRASGQTASQKTKSQLAILYFLLCFEAGSDPIWLHSIPHFTDFSDFSSFRV